MSSKPLLRRVADSMRILGPMSQLGFLRASAGVILARSRLGVLKNGPPEQVRVIFSMWTGEYFVRLRVWRRRRTAWCSESSGKICAPCLAASFMRRFPPRIIDSLFARASVLPAFSVAMLGFKPAEPAIAFTIMSALGVQISLVRSFGFFEVRTVFEEGRLRRFACFFRRFSFEWQARPMTLRCFRFLRITSSVWVPIEPVEPRIIMLRGLVVIANEFDEFFCEKFFGDCFYETAFFVYCALGFPPADGVVGLAGFAGAVDDATHDCDF